ncbi:hypothetical protein FDUTEX481_05184 [Tolypothrix sp. PCC 7601]|nr:hypothetical protein FDUTEX481_05184 [Tolypothrix sp. PCC 7601]
MNTDYELGFLILIIIKSHLDAFALTVPCFYEIQLLEINLIEQQA